MAKQCVTEKTAQRQRWIENGLLELMCQKKYAQISVTDLCHYLNLSRRSFYRYFEDINDVFDSLIDHTLQNLAVVPLRPTLQDLQLYFEFWSEHQEMIQALYHSGIIDKLFISTLRYTDFQIMTPEKQPITLDEDSRIFIIGGFLSLVLSWAIHNFEKSPAEMAQIGYKMLYEPFLKTE